MKIGLSTCGKKIDEDLFRDCAREGIEALELSGDKEITDALDYAQLTVWAEKYGINLWSLHLPFAPFEEIDISKPELMENTLSYWENMMKKARLSGGITKFVLHPSGEPISDSERPLRMETAKKGLKRLAHYAAELDAVVCVENLPRTCLGKNSEEIAELISADDRLRVVFDSNHLLQEHFTDFVDRVGDKIVTTHISDYDFADEKHWLPGEGDVDWQQFYTHLTAHSSNDMWLYEVGFTGHNKNGNRVLTVADFVTNAHEIFNGKSITVHNG